MQLAIAATVPAPLASSALQIASGELNATPATPRPLFARASFSTFNDDVEIAAPGVDVLSTWNNGGYQAISGTSMATPHVAGVAALIAGRVGAGPSQWRARLDASVDDLGAPGRDPQFGFGRVNLARALAP